MRDRGFQTVLDDAMRTGKIFSFSSSDGKDEMWVDYVRQCGWHVVDGWEATGNIGDFSYWCYPEKT